MAQSIRPNPADRGNHGRRMPRGRIPQRMGAGMQVDELCAAPAQAAAVRCHECGNVSADCICAAETHHATPIAAQAAAVPEAVEAVTSLERRLPDAPEPVKQWRIATNRHPNTDGTRWGWIEGAPGHICWSDERGSNLTRAQAGQMVLDHNNAIDLASQGAEPVATEPCPTCGAPCTTEVLMRGGDHGWSTSDKERTVYRFATPPAATQVEQAEPVAVIAAGCSPGCARSIPTRATHQRCPGSRPR